MKLDSSARRQGVAGKTPAESYGICSKQLYVYAPPETTARTIGLYTGRRLLSSARGVSAAAAAQCIDQFIVVVVVVVRMDRPAGG